MSVLFKMTVPVAAVYDRRYSFRNLAQNNLIKPRFS
jgi:hypothetical protein